MASHSISRLQSPHSTQLPGVGSRRILSFSSRSSSLSFSSFAERLENPWLSGAPLVFSLRSSNPNSLFAPSRRRIIASASLSLPTGKPERVDDGKLPNAGGGGGVNASRWSSRAIKSFAMGELEARKLKHTNTGTEALLMGILVEGTSRTAKFLRSHGISLTKVKDECVKLLGKGDFFFFSPEHPPLTEAALRALDRAVDEKLKSGKNGEITASDLLFGIWSEQGSPGQKILATLGFDDEKAQNLRSLSSEGGPDED